MNKDKVFSMKFAKVYELLVQKAERKGHTKDEVDRLIGWLCGYDQAGIRRQIAADATYKTFFDESPAWNPDSRNITGKICGVRIEDIEDPTMWRIRCLDKLVDELASGKSFEKIIGNREADAADNKEQNKEYVFSAAIHENPERGGDQLDAMKIRTATLKDLDSVTAVEATCFPAAEAATREEFRDRLSHYGNHFWLLFNGDKLVAFVDGFVTDEPDLTDEMYAKAEMHNENGAWQMIFGVNTIPEYRRHGYASQLIERAIADAREQNRKGLVLTCKDKLVHYYAGFGFQDEGVSEKSVHGGTVWHQMRLTF